MATIVPILLAGGEGKRLRPLSSAVRPKQFLRLADNPKETLFQSSLRRAMMVADPDHIITVASHRYGDLVQEQAAEIAPVLQSNVLLEPCAKNTAAAISLAAIHAANQYDNPILWVIPSDHMVVNAQLLKQAVQSSALAARHGKIVVFGIAPTRADSNYGYILGGQRLNRYESLYDVRMFIEKPFGAPLQWTLSQRHCFWNSGMFLFSAATLFNEMKRNNRAALEKVSQSYRGGVQGPFGFKVSGQPYSEIDAGPIDRVVMEKSKKLVVNPVDIGWSDIGSWQAVWELSQQSDNGNPLDKFLSTIANAA